MTIEQLKELVDSGVEQASKMTDLSSGRNKTEWRLILGERVYFKTLLNSVETDVIEHARWMVEGLVKNERWIDADRLIKLIDDDIATLDKKMTYEGYDICLCTLKMVKQYIKVLVEGKE